MNDGGSTFTGAGCAIMTGGGRITGRITTGGGAMGLTTMGGGEITTDEIICSVGRGTTNLTHGGGGQLHPPLCAV